MGVAGEIRMATNDEHLQIQALSFAIIESLKGSGVDVQTAMNILVVTLARVMVEQVKNGQLEDVLDLTIEGLRMQVANFEKCVSEQVHEH